MQLLRFARRSASPRRRHPRAVLVLAAIGTAALSVAAAATHAQDVEKPAAPKPAAPAKAAPPKPAPGLTLSIEVTDRQGAVLPGVAVAVAGPAERSGATSEKGSILFRTMRAGTYRLRFEHEDFVTLEREVVMRAGQPATVTVALTPAPEPPPPPEPLPAPEPPGPAPREPRDVAPRTLSIPDFLDKNLIAGEPHRVIVLGCAEGGTARLLQIRDPLDDQEHADLDELLYIVAGAGTLNMGSQETKVGPGFFALVPRGVRHSLRRQGRNPLIAMSVLAGEPCEEGQ